MSKTQKTTTQFSLRWILKVSLCIILKWPSVIQLFIIDAKGMARATLKESLTKSKKDLRCLLSTLKLGIDWKEKPRSHEDFVLHSSLETLGKTCNAADLEIFVVWKTWKYEFLEMCWGVVCWENPFEMYFFIFYFF